MPVKLAVMTDSQRGNKRKRTRTLLFAISVDA